MTKKKSFQTFTPDGQFSEGSVTPGTADVSAGGLVHAAASLGPAAGGNVVKRFPAVPPLLPS